MGIPIVGGLIPLNAFAVVAFPFEGGVNDPALARWLGATSVCAGAVSVGLDTFNGRVCPITPGPAVLFAVGCWETGAVRVCATSFVGVAW